MAAGSPFDVSADRRYDGVSVPLSESLKDTIARALPCLDERIFPALRRGERVLVVAHGNSLRGLVKALSGLSDDEILAFEIPTGTPIVYALSEDLAPSDRRFLALD
jgi:2,3-bisphosphoglycerate-dependent phosphoglycerate mutase